MEKNSWMTTSNKSKVQQEPWEYRNSFHGEDMYSGFSWPPRSYSCSFCKREFRSAQALGGHMNVHRRDRAKLRQSPPWEVHPQTSNLHPNPNPSFSTFSPSTKLNIFHSMHDPTNLSHFTSQTSTCPSPTSVKMLNTSPPILGSRSSKDEDLSKSRNTLKGFLPEEDGRINKGKKVMLDLQIGVGSNVSECDDLDLELRLGYSRRSL